MDAETADYDLVAAVREAPTPQARAALLGVDYDALVRTRRRFGLQSAAALGVIGITVALVATNPSGRRVHLAADAYFAGAGITVGLALAAFVLAQLAAAVLMRRLASRTAEVVFVGLYSLASLTALFISVILAGAGSMMTGVLIGAVISPVFATIGVAYLPAVIRSNNLRVVEVVQAQQAMPPWQTLLGHESRWMVAALAIASVSNVAAVLVFVQAGAAFLPVAVVAVTADMLAVLAGRTGRPVGWLAIQAATAVIVIVLASVVGA